jgi:hypothetical protein
MREAMGGELHVWVTEAALCAGGNKWTGSSCGRQAPWQEGSNVVDNGRH